MKIAIVVNTNFDEDRSDNVLFYDGIERYDIVDGCLCLWGDTPDNNLLEDLKVIVAKGEWRRLEIVDDKTYALTKEQANKIARSFGENTKKIASRL